VVGYFRGPSILTATAGDCNLHLLFFPACRVVSPTLLTFPGRGIALLCLGDNGS